MLSWLHLTPVLLPLLGCVAAALLGGDARRRGRLAALGTGVAALWVAGLTALDAVLGHSLGLPAVSTALLLVTASIGTVVLAYAGRYLALAAEPGRFFLGAGVLLSACSGVAIADTLLGFAACWSLAGLGLWLLTATDAPSRRRVALPLLIGEASLWTAVLLLLAGDATATLAATPTTSEPRLTAAALLLVVAALCRSALVPFHGWLTTTLAAPTPVSALLHAGFVNAGAVLILRLDGVITAVPAAIGLALVASGLSAVLGTTVMLVRPDTKGALAYSTTGQMGFLLFTAALGLPAVALVHPALHGAYKAAMFLDAGSTVHQPHHHGEAARPNRSAVLTATAAAATLLVVYGTLPIPHDPASTALLAFAAAALAAAGTTLVTRNLPTPTVLLTLGLVATGYLTVVGVGHLAIATETSAPATGTLLGAVAALALALATTTAIRRRIGGFGRLHDLAYVAALALGAAQRPARPARPRPGGGGRPPPPGGGPARGRRPGGGDRPRAGPKAR
jgi:NADH-quinone oxidoreductase subunit L/NAD(P)H-quinone oxidoreductase subunit 5